MLHTMNTMSSTAQTGLEVVAYLERIIVYYIACDYMDVLETRGSGLQVGQCSWVLDDGEHNSVRSTGLENRQGSILVVGRTW